MKVLSVLKDAWRAVRESNSGEQFAFRAFPGLSKLEDPLDFAHLGDPIYYPRKAFNEGVLCLVTAGAAAVWTAANLFPAGKPQENRGFDFEA